MAVTTVGQVVTTGQQLIVLTPNGGKLQVEALVANLDIGFVKPGQEAVIKVDAFPFTRFGALHGKVVNIASAAIAEQEAKRALANATARPTWRPSAPTARPANRKASFSRSPSSLDETAMKIDNATIPLDPGHDRHRRNQDRLPPRHRLPAVAPGQNRIGGLEGEVESRIRRSPRISRRDAACAARASRNDKSRRVSSSHSVRRTQTRLCHSVSRPTSRSSG